jgi:hypothetical protein
MLNIRPLIDKDIPLLEEAIDCRSLHHSPLRRIEDRLVRIHQKKLYRSIAASAVCQEGRMLLVAENREGPRAFMHLLTDYADNLYSLHQGTVLDLICPDEAGDAAVALMEYAEKILGDMGRRFIAVLAEHRNSCIRKTLSQMGFIDEYLHFLTTLSPSEGLETLPVVLKEASYGDVRALVDMGAEQAQKSLSPLRFLSYRSMKEEYAKSHAFDWAVSPEHTLCLMVHNRSGGLLGYLTVERDRYDLHTGTAEAHLTDLIFSEPSDRQKYLAPLLRTIDDRLLGEGISLRITAIPSGDGETEALLDLLEGHHDLERVQMVKSLRH